MPFRDVCLPMSPLRKWRNDGAKARCVMFWVILELIICSPSPQYQLLFKLHIFVFSTFIFQEDVHPVAQYEKLWGDMSSVEGIECSYFVVSRLRGQQLKDPAQRECLIYYYLVIHYYFQSIQYAPTLILWFSGMGQWTDGVEMEVQLI